MSIDMVKMRMKLDERDTEIARLRAALEEIARLDGNPNGRYAIMANKALAKEDK